MANRDKPKGYFTLTARAGEDFGVTFYRGWQEMSREEQDHALDGVVDWLRALIHADRDFAERQEGTK